MDRNKLDDAKFLDDRIKKLAALKENLNNNNPFSVIDAYAIVDNTTIDKIKKLMIEDVSAELIKLQKQFDEL